MTNSSIVDRALENRASTGGPVWAAELNSLMQAARNSFWCIELGRCLPLGGQVAKQTITSRALGLASGLLTKAKKLSLL